MRLPRSPWIGVTCEGLRVNENPLNGLPIFLTQLQVNLTGTVSLGPGGTEGKRINWSKGASSPSCKVRQSTEDCWRHLASVNAALHF